MRFYGSRSERGQSAGCRRANVWGHVPTASTACRPNKNTRAAAQTWAPDEFESEGRAEGAFHEYPRVAAHKYQSSSVKTHLYCLSATEEAGNH